MQDDSCSEGCAKPPVSGVEPPSTPQAKRQALDPASAAEIDRFIDKHRRLLEKLA